MSREDRFTWRHDCLLREIAKEIAEFLLQVNASVPSGPCRHEKKVRFVKPGTEVAPRTRAKNQRTGLLQEARDWVFDFHLPELSQDGSYILPA